MRLSRGESSHTAWLRLNAYVLWMNQIALFLFGCLFSLSSFSNDVVGSLDESESHSQENLLNLTESEKQWLMDNPVIRFAGDPNWLPYEAFNDKGEYIGIVADHLKIIQQRLGIQLDIIQTESWSESLEMVDRGEIDVLSETINSNLSPQLLFTQAYVTSPVVIVMRDDEGYVENVSRIQQRKIALITNYGYAPEIISNHPQIDFYNVNTIQQALTAVSIGEVDALFATLAQASYHISELGINNVRIVGKTEVNTTLSFGIQPEFAPLVPLFNRAISSITLSERQQIFDRWGNQRFSVKTDYALIINALIIFLLFLAIIVYWNRKLGREVIYRKEIERQTQALIDHIPLQVIVTALDGCILSANPKALADYQIPDEKLDQYKVHDFFTNIDDAALIRAEIQSKGVIDQKIVPFNHPDGSSHEMMVSIIPIRYHNQKALLSIAVDMTERLDAERELKRSIEHAERASAAKSHFLANMSHEIRTPMNAIIGYTELLTDEIKEPKLKSFAKTIQTAGNNLLLLINDILDLSKIEAGKFQIELKPSNPHELFTEIGNIFMIKIRENNLDFILEIEKEIPQGLLLDYTRLRQVLFNLVGNAVKFTHEGFIKISAKICDENTSLNTIDLIIDVEDSGIGISKENHQIVFEKFEQSIGQDNRQYGGTGLGLSISKRLIEMMGGSLSVSSVEGKGSVFSIILTNIQISTAPEEQNRSLAFNETEYRFSNANILVVDDVKDNRELLIEYFSDSEVNIIEAKNGLEAVNLCKNGRFDLVLMDIRMPVMNGYQAAEEIKKISDVPIVALTASVMTDEFEKLKRTNFDGYIRKPIFKKNLFHQIRAFIPFKQSSGNEVSREIIAPDIKLDDAELKILSNFLPEFKKLSQSFKGIDKINNLDRIVQFTDAIAKLNETYPVKLMVDYEQKLRFSAESFDIAQIKYQLSRFEDLIGQLETFKDTHKQSR